MGKDTEPISVQPCEESVSELKPVYMVAGDLMRPLPTVASTMCTDIIKHDSVIIMNNKQYDSQKFSKCSGNSANFIGEDSTLHLNAVASDKRQTTFCNWNLPLHEGSDTLVIPDSNHADYLGTTTESFFLFLGEDLPNECASTKKRKGVLASSYSTARISLIERLFGSSAYIHPKTEKPQYKHCPTGHQSTTKSSQTESGGSGHQGSCVTGYSSSSTRSSLVTGIGGFGGGGGGDDPWQNRPVSLPPSHYTDFIGFPEEQTASYRHAIITPSPIETPRETTARFTRLGSQPAFLEEIPELTFLSPTTEPAEETSSDIGSALDLIHLMSRHNIRQNVHPGQGLVSPRSPVLANLDMVLSPCPTPSTPSSVPSPCLPSPQLATAPQLTTTPQQATSNSPSSLFIPKSFIQGDKRICELTVPEDIPRCNRILPLRALFHSANLYWKFEHCLEQPYDLKVANDARAKLCDFVFDHEQSKLVFSMPKDCKPVGEWLKDNRESMDLRDGLFILQQVMNTLAAIHTVGNEDFLSFWGAFMVWVSPDMRVYLLVDFPELYRKQQTFANSDANLNPRIEDIHAIHKIYTMIVQPYTDFNSCWVSPGVYQMMSAYERLLVDPTSGSRLAELARTLGETRMCKLEVDLETLNIFIYSLDHESLQSALQPLRGIVPGRLSKLWCVQWMLSGEMVKRRDVATADRRMLFVLIPVEDIHDGEALHITSDFPFH